MDYFPYHFSDQITLHGVGKSRVITYKVLFLPTHFEEILPFKQYPRLRVEGEIADVPVRGAWMPVGDGRRYFIVAPQIKTDTGRDVGDDVEMRFRIDDQDFVDVPAALTSALSDDPEAETQWRTLSAGKKRMFTHHVAGAKTQPTTQRRIDEALEAIRAGMSLRDMQRARKNS